MTNDNSIDMETHTVTFKDYDGTILNTQQVFDGDDAIPPENPYREHYVFQCWNPDYKNVTQDLECVAQYYAIQYPENGKFRIIPHEQFSQSSTKYSYDSGITGTVRVSGNVISLY